VMVAEDLAHWSTIKVLEHGELLVEPLGQREQMPVTSKRVSTKSESHLDTMYRTVEYCAFQVVARPRSQGLELQCQGTIRCHLRGVRLVARERH